MSTIKDNLHALHNKHRSLHGRRSLNKVSVLNAGAQKLADQMARNQWQSGAFGSRHRRPNGQSFESWWSNTYRNTFAYYSRGAENLGWGSASATSGSIFGSQNSHGSCSSGCSNWTISQLHHEILIRSYWRRVGYGVAWDSRGRSYWVVHFTD